MDGSISAIGDNINKTLDSITDEIKRFTVKLTTGAKLTAQDTESFLKNLERRDHAVNAWLDQVTAQHINYKVPDALQKRLADALKGILALEHGNTRAKVEQLMAQHHAAVWNVLKKIDHTVKRERPRISAVDKSEQDPL